MQNFSARFHGPGGGYTLTYDTEDMSVSAVLDDQAMVWHVFVENPEEDTVSGITTGSKPLWGDVFWFVLSTVAPRRVEYWGDRVLVRVDQET